MANATHILTLVSLTHLDIIAVISFLEYNIHLILMACLVSRDYADEVVSHYCEYYGKLHWFTCVCQLYIQCQCTAQSGRLFLSVEQLHASYFRTRCAQYSQYR